ncbi:M56 family metallopeptidase [Paenibacillus hemerocallicola]|uniref:M56 family metallopeptidase n=1 Tax=Paenibacillus hemerocallicola TaxID=1172614 RepID=A0A5C4SZM9_9BACL|nr:M56 family metallopeptidase [Paenibacillus hemerocallicola]TNJ62224.1 M56 family metallopeptidase [Paenibacillus hemerocallicola]
MSPSVKLRWIYILMVVFLALFSVQMGLFVAHQMEGRGLGTGILIYIVFDLIIGYTLIRAIWRITAQAYLSRKWHKLFSSNRHAKLTKHLNYKYRGLGTEIIVVRNEAFVALAIGMYRPKIVISTQVLHMFNDDEVKAILLHEWHHCRNHDSIKLFIMTLLTEAFGYWPIMKPIFRYYQTWTELLADRFAIRQMGTELHLGSVLLKLSKLGKTEPVTAVHFAASAMHYRMLQVLEPHQTVKVKISLLRPLLASLSLLLLLMLGGDT